MTESKQTLTTKCYVKLTESILKGEILPGEKLLCEELKARYDVGMSPIREALSKLAATHLVTFEEHKGYSVAKMSASQLTDRILSFAEIECLCLKLAIENGNDSWEGGIIASLHCLKKLETAPEADFFSWAPLNAQFHNALVTACPFKALMEIRNQLYQQHQWVILLSYKVSDRSMIRANHQEHLEIGEAAIARKMQEACHKLYVHSTTGIEELISQLNSRSLIDDNR